MITLRELCLRQVARHLELLARQPWSARYLELLPDGTADELAELLGLLGRWERLSWTALRLLLVGGAPRQLDLSGSRAVEDEAFRAIAVESGCALKRLRASSWISDATVLALLQRSPVERLHLSDCAHLRLALPPSAQPSASEPLSERLLELDLLRCGVGDSAMRRLLPGLPAMRTLRASATRLTPLAFARAAPSAPAGTQLPAAVLPQLRTLELSCGASFAARPAPLAGCFPRLASLDLGRAREPARAQPAAPVGELASALRTWAGTLRVLRLAHVPSVGAGTFAGAGELRALEELDLSGCSRADEAVAELRAPALARLSLGGGESPRSADRALLALARAGGGAPAGLAHLERLRALELHACAGGLPALLPLGRCLCALTALALFNCGALADATAAALADGCPALSSLEIRSEAELPCAALLADGEGARRLLRGLRHVSVDALGSADGAALRLSLPLAEHVRVRLAPSCQLGEIDAPACRTLALGDVVELAGAEAAQPPSAESAGAAAAALTGGRPRLKRPRPSSAGAAARAGPAALRVPALEQLALVRCEPLSAVALVHGALGSARALRLLCAHDCPLGAQQLALLGAHLGDAARHSLRACQLTGSALPVDDCGVRALYASGALGDVCLLSRARLPQSCHGFGAWPCACSPIWQWRNMGMAMGT